MGHQRSTQMPHQVADTLVAVGHAIRVARLRRRQPAADLAARIGVSLPTLRKLERGDPTASLGTFATAAWVLGLLTAISESVQPENDRVAASIEASRIPKRARRSRQASLDDL